MILHAVLIWTHPKLLMTDEYNGLLDPSEAHLDRKTGRGQSAGERRRSLGGTG